MTRRRCRNRKRCAEDLHACREQIGLVVQPKDGKASPQFDSGRRKSDLTLRLGSAREKRRCSRVCSKDLRACKRLQRKQRQQALHATERSSVDSNRNSMCKEGANSDAYWDVLLRHCVSCESVCGQHPRQCDTYCEKGNSTPLEGSQLHRQIRSITGVRGEKAITQPSSGGYSGLMLAGPLLAVLLISIFCGLATLAFRRRKRSSMSQPGKVSMTHSRNLSGSHLNPPAMNNDDLTFQLPLLPGMCEPAENSTHNAPDTVLLSYTFKPRSVVGPAMNLEDCGKEIISHDMPVKRHESTCIGARDSPAGFCLIEKGRGSGE
uniref:TACI cysteine-rich domain-containing protein n=1 Tax=Eptatretus burgeri TaxID=7764 RepID=A0A8C4NB77_EPTBU